MHRWSKIGGESLIIRPRTTTVETAMLRVRLWNEETWIDVSHLLNVGGGCDVSAVIAGSSVRITAGVFERICMGSGSYTDVRGGPARNPHGRSSSSSRGAPKCPTYLEDIPKVNGFGRNRLVRSQWVVMDREPCFLPPLRRRDGLPCPSRSDRYLPLRVGVRSGQQRRIDMYHLWQKISRIERDGTVGWSQSFILFGINRTRHHLR